ncbi:transcription factor-like 5 protein isoform X1 [Acanthochromis polyacanthus]|uniref:Transcription factor like 5 n=1 Tax=Acanthochromis polyacanthus TaxID=80966 RepID=A0A3Q1GYK7_9TELE|nr:transcription factor-like 5 protein isoform X1 [Acanthochromis polyacanthus]
MSFSTASKTIHVPSSSREQTCDSVGLILSQGGCLTYDQGQMLGSELGLMEMSEVEYSHLQHLIQADMEAQARRPHCPDARSYPAAVVVKDVPESAVICPFTATQAIDLSTSSDDHCLVMPGQRTPASYGDVPGFVLAKIRGEESTSEVLANSSKTSQKRSGSAARVCLEKRFNTVSADTPRQQDIQSAVLSNFLTVLKQTAGAVIHPQKQKWMKTVKADCFKVSTSYAGSDFEPVTNICGQVIAHMVEPNKHQGVIIPKTLVLNFQPDRVVATAQYTSSSNPAEEQKMTKTEKDNATLAAFRSLCSTQSFQPKAARAATCSSGDPRGGARKRTFPRLSPGERRGRHNIKERERRKKIRLCCDELNMMVPFCGSETDKATTLQWTTAFLRYINKMYGDTFKEEFEKVFTCETGVLLKSISPSGQDPIQQDMEKTLSVAAEQ